MWSLCIATPPCPRFPQIPRYDAVLWLVLPLEPLSVCAKLPVRRIFRRVPLGTVSDIRWPIER